MSPARDPAKYMRERRARLSDRLTKRLQLGDHLERSYGLTLKEYDRLLMNQQGNCAACDRPPKEGRRLHVDHDHHTGEVRGLLCSGCNAALGFMEESPLLLHELAYYAEFCVQRRNDFTADQEDRQRSVIAAAFEKHLNAPYLVNAMRESLLRLYARPTKPPVKRGSKKASDVLPLVPIVKALELAAVRTGDAREAIYV